jgi:hypothetical protein
MERRNSLFNIRTRCAVAEFKQGIGHFSPFMVVVGGSDMNSSLSSCELYYPETD